MRAKKHYEGIPESVTLEKVESWIRPRISQKRLMHTLGVVEVARKLAVVAGCDPFLAELSAWLHDACKEVKDKELVAKAEKAGLALSEIERAYGHLLHGPVAAVTAREELGVTNQDVLDAVSQHTLGFAPMSNLSKVLFLSDCLEESRPKDYTEPIWNALDPGAANDLDLAIVVACDLGITHLIESRKPIHRRTVEVRNYYLDLIGDRLK